ncbi:MAG: ABC transporter ATP-binding protein [Desulfosarcinaceae bacterium]
MNNHAVISATDLTKAFGALQVIKGVNLAVQKGEFVVIVGKSGSGKTTLLSLLSGLERPSSGRVALSGQDITASSEDELALIRRKAVGFIFQSFHLIPTLSAWENVALPLFPVKRPVSERRRRALELLEKMELEHRAEHRPAALSGGEKQRVAIARALVNDPDILFADEPTGNQNGLSLVMVTHDLDLAASADRIVRMQDGRVVS